MAKHDNFGQSTINMAVLEAVLFLSNEPLSLEKLSYICGISDKEIKKLLNKFKQELEKEERGLVLLETPQGYQLGTKPEIAAFVERMFAEEGYSHAPLSQAALETLAIIAVKQPVTKLEIERIRGVKVEGVLENLLKRGLIKVTGRKESLGRPILYGVTEDFFKYFGIKDMDELEELKKIWLNDTVFPEEGETK